MQGDDAGDDPLDAQILKRVSILLISMTRILCANGPASVAPATPFS
jgi:hypothetical protein